MIEWVTLSWEDFKVWLSATVGLSHEELHVVVGALIFLGVAGAFRWPLRSYKPLLVVMAFEAVNETLDYTRYARAHWPWERNATMLQIVLTLSVPVTIMIVARLAQAFSARRTPSASS